VPTAPSSGARARSTTPMPPRPASCLDHHHTVGHSFFMAKHFSHRDLGRTWLRQIRPLIDEYFFDQPDLVQQFDLPMFWPSHPSL
jgi:hypothetical protein